MEKLEQLVTWLKSKTPKSTLLHRILDQAIKEATPLTWALFAAWTLLLALWNSSIGGWRIIGLLIGMIGMVVFGIRLVKEIIKSAIRPKERTKPQTREEELIQQGEAILGIIDEMEQHAEAKMWLVAVRGYLSMSQDYEWWPRIAELETSLEGTGNQWNIITEAVGILKNFRATRQKDKNRQQYELA